MSDTIVLGTGPVHVGPEGEPLRAAVADALTSLLGATVRISQAASYAELRERVARGESQVAWMSPALAMHAIDDGATPLVSSARSSGAQFFGALFVRATSKVRKPEELHGARVAWVDRDSCSGYLFPRLALAKRGLAEASLFADEKFLASHGAVARAVATGAADAGATYYNVADDEWTGDTVAAGWAEATLEPMRVLLRTDPIPADLVVASKSLAPSLRSRVQAVLLDLHATPSAAAAVGGLFGARRFEAVDMARYDVVRAALQKS